MADPREEGRERRHRGELEKEEEQELEDEVENFDDLLGGPTENSTAATTAAAFRSHRGPAADPEKELAAYQRMMESDLLYPAAHKITVRDHTTADEPDDDSRSAAPPDEDDEESNMNMPSNLHARESAAAPTATEEQAPASDWLRDDDQP